MEDRSGRTYYWSCQIQGIEVARFRTCEGLGYERNFFEAPGEKPGTKIELRGSLKVKRITLTHPEEGSVTTIFISLVKNSGEFVMTLQLKDHDGNVRLSAQALGCRASSAGLENLDRMNDAEAMTRIEIVPEEVIFI